MTPLIGGGEHHVVAYEVFADDMGTVVGSFDDEESLTGSDMDRLDAHHQPPESACIT